MTPHNSTNSSAERVIPVSHWVSRFLPLFFSPQFGSWKMAFVLRLVLPPPSPRPVRLPVLRHFHWTTGKKKTWQERKRKEEAKTPSRNTVACSALSHTLSVWSGVRGREGAASNMACVWANGAFLPCVCALASVCECPMKAA